MNLGDSFWASLTPSSMEELKKYEEEICKESLKLINEKPEIAEDAFNKLIMFLDVRKIAHDMYVWQRVDAVKRGIKQAKDKFILVGAEQ